MAKELTQYVQNKISDKNLGINFTLNIANTDYSSYLINWNVSNSRQFGSATATFTLDNSSGIFSQSGSDELKAGDLVEFTEKYKGDNEDWNRFYGFIDTVSLDKSRGSRQITINCLDYISMFQNWSLDLEEEADKVEITNETLTPSYLPAPNDSLAQVFNFDNDDIAQNPAPVILIRDLEHSTDDPQYDGFETLYSSGQLKLGSPLNALDNYEVRARSYWVYTQGLYVEDILENIIKESDGYGGYIFGESSASDVVDNHLKTTYQAEEGSGNQDSLTANAGSVTLTIKHQLASSVSVGDSSIELSSVEGLPDSGSAEINGDTFTWSSIGSGNTLQGISESGSNAIKAHNASCYVEYEATYDIGQVWYLSYSNITTTLTSSDFSIPSGSTIDYINERGNQDGAYIILDSAIPTTSSVVCTNNYECKTLQSTGVQLNYISFKERELENRYQAIEKLRNFIAPNYVIRTQGDSKIWASYLQQKTTADYSLDLIRNINYLQDEDLYTRVITYTKNDNPTNIVLGNESAEFSSDGQTYKSLASQNELTYAREEGNYYVYQSSISNAGYIDGTEFTPIVYVNNVAIDNKLKRMVGISVRQDIRTRTTIKTGCHGMSSSSYTKQHTYYYYTIRFAHQNIEPSKPIHIYDATGLEVITISSEDDNMDYGRGLYHVPGDKQNSKVESVSTATYWVFYSTKQLEIDYDNVEFKMSKDLIVNTDETIVKADYEYWTTMIPIHDVASVIDGRWDTDTQIEFFSEPPTGYQLTILDLGSVHSIQAMDIVAGFFEPDDIRKFDIDFTFSIQYSTDGTSYQYISSTTRNISLSGGESVSFEEQDLGVGFQARYLKILIENVEKIDFGNGVWVVSLAELSLYGDIVIESESKLIATTTLTSAVDPADTTINVNSTSQFDEPESGETKTAYIDKDSDKSFTYTGLTATSFTGVSLSSGVIGAIGEYVTQSIEGDLTVYDDNGMLQQLGDRLIKHNFIDDNMLFNETQSDSLAKNMLEEYIKEHTKRSVNVIYSPYLKIGQTVSLTDTYNNETDVKYFIEEINEQNGFFELTIAKYD